MYRLHVKLSEPLGFSEQFRTIYWVDTENDTTFFGNQVSSDRNTLEVDRFYSGYIEDELLQDAATRFGKLNIGLNPGPMSQMNFLTQLPPVLDGFFIDHMMRQHFLYKILCSTIGIPRFDIEIIHSKALHPQRLVDFIYELLEKSDFQLYQVFHSPFFNMYRNVGHLDMTIFDLIKYRLMLVRTLKYIQQLYEETHGDVIDKKRIRALYPIYDEVDVDVDTRDCVDAGYYNKY